MPRPMCLSAHRVDGGDCDFEPWIHVCRSLPILISFQQQGPRERVRRQVETTLASSISKKEISMISRKRGLFFWGGAQNQKPQPDFAEEIFIVFFFSHFSHLLPLLHKTPQRAIFMRPQSTCIRRRSLFFNFKQHLIKNRWSKRILERVDGTLWCFCFRKGVWKTHFSYLLQKCFIIFFLLISPIFYPWYMKPHKGLFLCRHNGHLYMRMFFCFCF